MPKGKRNQNQSKNKYKRKELAFIVPSPRAVPTSFSSVSRMLNKEKKKFFSQHVSKTLEEVLPMALKGHSKLIASSLETVVDKSAFGVIDHVREGISNRSSSRFGYAMKESVAGGLMGELAVEGSTRLKTKFTTGTPCSDSVLKMEQLCGSSTYKLFNTEFDLQEERECLSVKFGFNQKRYVFLGNLFTTCVKDYVDLFGFTKENNPFIFPSYSDQSIYGMIKYEKMRLKLANTNRYLPINCSVHLVELLDREMSMSNLCDYTFHSKVDNPDVKSGKIPHKYQLRDVVVDKSENIEYHKSVICSPQARLDMSAAFNQNAKIVKTLRHKLTPASIWDIDITVLLGPGIYIDQMFYDDYVMTNKSTSQPSTYGIIIDFIGSPCVGVEVKDGQRKQDRQGTNQGSVSMEFSKSIEMVNADISFTKNGFEASKAALKLYNRDISTSTIFNKDYNEISDKHSDNSFYIPVKTDSNITDAGEL